MFNSMVTDDNLKYYIQESYKEYNFEMRLYSRVAPLSFNAWLAAKLCKLFPDLCFEIMYVEDKKKEDEEKAPTLFDLE